MDIPIAGYEPNGRLLIVEVSNATEWPTDPRVWERYACRVAGRPLTPQEWRDLVPNRPVQRVCAT